MQEPRYRRYAAHEPDVNQQPGVYSLARPQAAALDTATFHVPRAFGAAFFAFLHNFLSDPMANPVFARERRRLGRKWARLLALPRVVLIVGYVGLVLALSLAITMILA